MTGSVLRRRAALAAGAVVLLGGVWILSTFVCLSAWLRYGIVVDSCPDGAPRQRIFATAHALRRGTPGRLRVRAGAAFTPGPSDAALTAPLQRFTCRAFFVAESQEKELVPRKGWSEDGSERVAEVELPEVPDGDYLLRVKVHSALGDASLDLPVALFAPARIHVVTDRPLYEPGNVVQFRSVVLRESDLAPLESRPGRWRVLDPSGELVLDEKSTASGWGVASGSFPLDTAAVSGEWTVRWDSAGARGTASFRVEPFTLPRFTVRADAAKPFYGAGETPVLGGEVAYSSGAPVASAIIGLRWSSSGEWPPPTEWLEGDALPKQVTADASGRFTLTLPAVPADLQQQARLLVTMDAVDSTGDRVSGFASVLLSKDPIQVTAVTELGDGLVEGFNNRLFLRLTDAAGRVLPDAQLLVKRAWEPADRGLEAQTDEDGVAALQLDPGPAVNVVVPPMPVRIRKAKPAAPVVRAEVQEVLEGETSLADLRAMDGWLRKLEPCTRFGAGRFTIGLRVDSQGGIGAVGSGSEPGAECLAARLSAERLPPGPERLYKVSFALRDSGVPRLLIDSSGAPDTPDGLDEQLERFAADARACVPASLSEPKQLPRLLIWQTRKGSRKVELGWRKANAGDLPFLQSGVECAEQKFRGFELEDEQESSNVGYALLSVAPLEREQGEPAAPQPTTVLAYEFVVSARLDGADLGATRLRVEPGTVPNLRLRATPILPKPGESLSVEVLRGPQFEGELPEKLTLRPQKGKPIEAKVDPEKRLASFALPADVEGWVEISWGGARAMAYVRPKRDLVVELEPEKKQYAPGEQARLLVTTKAGGKPTRAAVALLGVDQSLAQLAALPEPTAMAALEPAPQVEQSAFEALDAQALAAGKIRGLNAAAATVLKVSGLPPAPTPEQAAAASVDTPFDPVAELTDRFYTVLAELHVQARRWEEQAPKAEKMQPERMARLWQEALRACQARGENVSDAYGRPLRLSQLPSDLLVETAPRAVLIDGMRLPEDLANWQAWVAKEQP